MPISNELTWHSPSEIVVERGKRQRQSLELDETFVKSIARGIINPLVVRRKTLLLVAGERRLEASKIAQLPSIPCRYLDTLDPLELLELELDENLKRKDLSWQDEARAIAHMHEVYYTNRPGWSQEKTADRIGCSPAKVAQYLRICADLHDPKISGAVGMTAAYNLLARRDSRVVDDALDTIVEAGLSVFQPRPEASKGALPVILAIGDRPAPAPPPLPPSLPILNTSFLEWAPTYSGPRFNFIHCDFPYGVKAFHGGVNRQHSIVGYADDPDLYWELLSSLCSNLDRLMSPSSHLLFWFSMANYTKTLEFFRLHAPSLVFDPFPLIWFKSCNTGMVPDPNRQPRRVYETALMASREDRKILRPLANCYAAPTNSNRSHPSEKPVPVLRHFFQMFVDETTRMLDPTCGGASALEAAEGLGAKDVLGIELDSDHHTQALRNLRNFRALKKVG